MDEVSTFAYILSQQGFQQDHLEMIIRRNDREPGRLSVHRVHNGFRVKLLDGKWRVSAIVEDLTFDSVAAVLPVKIRDAVKESFLELLKPAS